MHPISESALEALARLDIPAPNAIQAATWEAAQGHQDLILLAPTGSGKTLAYLLPLLDRLRPDLEQVQALILAPSRELALQIEEVFKKLQTGCKVSCCYGGHDLQTEKQRLSQAPALLIGTPGRILDHLERGHVQLQHLKTLVLDEFDKSLEFGFQEQMAAIIGQAPPLRQRILTSATDLADIPPFVGLRQAVRLDFLGTLPAPKLSLHQVRSPEPDKLETLFQLLCKLGGRACIVFLNHREAVERVGDFLGLKRIPHSIFHGGLEQPMRERQLAKFRNGSNNVLVTTDLAARGLDIPEIEAIVHYQLPPTEDTFIHRNGRTARMHAEGHVYLLIGPAEHLPGFVPQDLDVEDVSGRYALPPAPAWATLYIGKGKRDKVSKVDLVGFLCQQGGLVKADLGYITIQDDHAYVAVRRELAQQALTRTQGQKLKGKAVKVQLSR
jgi:ATP-independent RNA helicase DbpA